MLNFVHTPGESVTIQFNMDNAGKMVLKNNNFVACSKGTRKNNLIQLDVGNLAAKSMSSFIEEPSREFKSTETQTDSEDFICFQVKRIEEKHEAEKETMKLTFAKEKSELKKAYKDLLEEKNQLISNLASEKDFLWQEIRHFRDNFSMCENINCNDLDWDPEWDHSDLNVAGKVTKPMVKTMVPLNIQEKEIALCSMMALRKKVLKQQYKRDKQAVLDKVEIEKDLIRDEITTELESRYSDEISGLHDIINGLKQALEDMKTQKNELAKIFQGERNALEMGFSRKEQELKDKMARDLQRELVKAHQDWTRSKI